MSSNQQLLQLLSPIQIQQQLQKLQHKQHKIQQEISKSAQQITENSFQKQQHDLSTSWPPQQFDNNNNNVDNKKHFKLSYVDFPPRCAGAGNVICNPDYEKFEYVCVHFKIIYKLKKKKIFNDIKTKKNLIKVITATREKHMCVCSVDYSQFISQLTFFLRLSGCVCEYGFMCLYEG